MLKTSFIGRIVIYVLFIALMIFSILLLPLFQATPLFSMILSILEKITLPTTAKGIIVNSITFHIPTIITAGLSIYSMKLFSKRKETKNYSPLTKREIILLLLPILYVVSVVVLKFMIQSIIPLETWAICLHFPEDPTGCVTPTPQQYDALSIILALISVTSFMVIVLPWFSYAHYLMLRKKQ